MARTMALLLDRDGTIVLWDEMFLACISDACGRVNVKPPPAEVALSFECWDLLCRDRLVIGGQAIRINTDSIPREYIRAYGRPVPGAVQALSALASAGVALAIVSSWTGTEPTKALLSAWGLDSAVDSVITADDLGDDDPIDPTQRKRMAVELALQKMGARGQTWMVGDSVSDIAVGKEVGAITVAVLTGNGSRELDRIGAAGADYVVPSLRELPPLMLGPEISRHKVPTA